MKKNKIKTILPSLLFTLFLCMNICLADSSSFAEAYAEYKSLLANGEPEKTLIAAKSAYEQAQKSYPDGHQNRLATLDNYILILMELKRYDVAAPLIKQLLVQLEQKHGKHAEALIPYLNDLSVAMKISHPQQSLAAAKRKQAIYLRHNSQTVLAKLEEKPLTPKRKVKNSLAKVSSHFSRPFSIYETEHWSIIHDAALTPRLRYMENVMEQSYDSVMSFLIAFGVRSKALDHKMIAIYLPSKEDYQSYVSRIATKTIAGNTGGLYSRKEDALFVFANNKNKNKILRANPAIIAHEAAHQIMFEAGLQRNAFNQPKWLREGLATSFEVVERGVEVGPHRVYISKRRMKGLGKMLKKGSLPSVRAIVSSNLEQEGQRFESVQKDYVMGAMLIKYLYAFYPDEFKDYFGVLANAKQTAGSASRRRMFRRAFGDIASHEQPFQEFVLDSYKASKAYWRERKSKKLSSGGVQMSSESGKKGN